MFLKRLSVVNYKSLSAVNFDLDSKINCFVGNNGVGKTNVLDAIYYLAFGKSYFNTTAFESIRYGESFFMIEGVFDKQGKQEDVICSQQKGRQKTVKHNGKVYEKLSDYIGFVPLVIISPADRDIITEGSDIRRKFLDVVISQNDKNYLNEVISYNKALKQRNALLKYFAVNQTFDADALDLYDVILIEKGNYIHSTRKDFIEAFRPIFNTRYKTISGKNEEVSLQYESMLLNEDFKSLLSQSLTKDKILQHTTVGIHKDDLEFKMQGFPIKKNGSQGQQKSLLVALKLAQFDFLKQQGKQTPILLLDDVFDKLDSNRVTHIIKLVNDENFGQLFISDTDLERTEKTVKSIHQSYKIFSL